MKILFLNIYDHPRVGGGAEMTLHHLMQSLRGRGVEPVILATSPTPGLTCVERDGVRVWRAGLRNVYWPDMRADRQPHSILRTIWHCLDSYNPLMQPVLREVLRRERPDVVSFHNLPGWSAAAWRTVRTMGIPTVQVLHDMYALCPRTTMYREGHGNCRGQCMTCRIFRLPHRRLSRLVSAVVGVSRFILDQHLAAGLFAGVPIRRVIHNARDPVALGVQDYIPRIPGPETRIGFLGRIEAVKGVELLIEAFQTLHLDTAQLWIAGDGKADYVESLRTRYRHNQNIRFLGRVRPKDFFPHVDFVVMPSLCRESLGMVAAEALAFGKPVIGFRHGGIPEIIRHGENGLLCDTLDELIAAMRTLVDHPTLRTRMARMAPATAQPYLSPTLWADAYLQVYRLVAQR